MSCHLSACLPASHLPSPTINRTCTTTGLVLYNSSRLYRNHLQTMCQYWQAIKCRRWWWWRWWWIGQQLCHLGIDSGCGMCVCPIGVRVTNRLSPPPSPAVTNACQEQYTTHISHFAGGYVSTARTLNPHCHPLVYTGGFVSQLFKWLEHTH